MHKYMLLLGIEGGIRSGKEAIQFGRKRRRKEREKCGEPGVVITEHEKKEEGDTYVKGGKRRRVFIKLGG